ncbi:MAG TPA: response regulator, partial [Desulfobacterales bacterium]|nr:response regulator [Desulfobacterales bacterium]
MKNLIGMKILIVDDDPVVQELIKDMLAKEGYKNIQTVGSGEEALKMMKQNPPDLVVLDILLPGIQGYEVCRKIRAGKATVYTPVLMMTGSILDKEKALEKSFEAGVTDFITKPIKTGELLARVKSALTIKQQYNRMIKQLNE